MDNPLLSRGSPPHQLLPPTSSIVLARLMNWESCSQGCFMISSAEILSSPLGRPGDGIEKLRVELVVGGGDLSPVLKLQTSSVIPK